MAEKRMFSKKIIDTDWFMDMPASSQNLYFHLSMRADDDGFVSSPKRIIKLIGATDDDYRILISKKFIIPFESGVCVITDWRINNYLRNDRYTETVYKQEKQSLTIDENGKYNLGIPTVDQVLYLSNSKSNSETNSIKENNLLPCNTNVTDILQNSISISNKDNNKIKHKYGEYKHILLTDNELEKLKKDYNNWQELIKYLDEAIELKGYKYKSHYLAIKKWVVEAVSKDKVKKGMCNSRDYTNEDMNNLICNIDDIEI